MEYFFYGLAAPVLTAIMVVIFMIRAEAGKITKLLEEIKDLLHK